MDYMKQMNYDSSSSSLYDDDDNNSYYTDSFKRCYGCANGAEHSICCLTCKRTYHPKCHIPPITSTTISTNLGSDDMEPWTCTMCIDIDHVSREMSEGTSDPNKNTLDENEICMASRILLELLCDTDNSFKFMNFPPKYLFPRYYEVIFLPVSLYSVKYRLRSKDSYYTSFSDVIVDIKRIYSNALFFFLSSDISHKMAQKQQNLLFEILTKWVPQYHTDPNN